ncbi:hypothetical protein BW723_00115 [Polaribacter reichenbachii]|uniref:Protein NO VEIN C-terminal domain-containing protein n=1 Tax=Polaribacter reichenbachii TaxID=996801 RepID=A0A1B8U501_9FLAO|nr:DUF3883 domain-containing protein [Polaribacter reichenbachii]APZ44789.1 hypothetical protein BW723_00115 [Polaribacter reichenbachii]AUC18653.1 hypothetical protein BTO17_08120 [Polaribacter reichenbachii]OBY66948.1 hypothetical protein LPB301_05010 [Polaribacter reichenbachii]
MEKENNKHQNYEILNLIGYGLAKFNNLFINQFGFKTKKSFFEYFVSLGIAETTSVVKNRMDLFDPFFDNNRKGWWQKGDTYIHRKVLIDSLFGSENIIGYSNIVKLYLKENYKLDETTLVVKPIIKSRFRKLQETGLEAELYFMNNFNSISIFENGKLEDARLYGDGYDFQINVNDKFYLSEIKGIKSRKGRFRMTENEYKKALEYKNDYLITVVLNMSDSPRLLTIANPTKNLSFKKIENVSRVSVEYHLEKEIN